MNTAQLDTINFLKENILSKPGLVGGRAPQTEGHRLRGLLLHDGRGGPGPVAEEDGGAHHQHRPRQLGAALSGQSSPGQSWALDYALKWRNNRYSCTK